MPIHNSTSGADLLPSDPLAAAGNVGAVRDTPPPVAGLQRLAWRSPPESLGRTGSNLVFASAAEIVIRGAGLISVVVLARYLEPESFGAFNTLLAYFAIAVVLGNFGLERFALRELARHTALHEEILPTLLTLRSAAGLTTAAILLAVGMASGEFASFQWIALAVIAANIGGGVALSFYARERFGIPSAAGAATSITMTVLSLCGVALEAPFSFFLVALCVAELVRLAWLLAAARREQLRLRLGFEHGLARRALTGTLPYAALALLGAVYFRVDLLMLEYLAGARSAGHYASAYRIFEVLLVVPGLLTAVLAPRFTRLQHTDVAQHRAVYLLACRTLLWLGIVIGTVGTCLASQVFRLLFGEAYVEAVPAFVWLMVATVFLFWNAPNSAVLLAGDRLYGFVALSLLATVVNVSANWVLIPRYGVVGAAGTTAASEILFVALLTWHVCRRLGITAREYLLALRPRLSRTEIVLLVDRLPSAQSV